MTLAYYGHDITNAVFLLQEEEIVKMEEAAHAAYIEEPPAVAVWALENYVDTVERLKQEREAGRSDNPYLVLTPDASLVMAHARLALLHHNLRDETKSDYHLEEAMAHNRRARLAGIEDKEDLIRLMNNIDNRYRVTDRRLALE